MTLNSSAASIPHQARLREHSCPKITPISLPSSHIRSALSEVMVQFF